MKTMVEEWNCSVDVKEEIDEGERIVPTYNFTTYGHVRPQIRRVYTFHFKYWKKDSPFMNMSYRFNTVGHVDWEGFKANSPIGMIKFKDMINCMKKGVKYKLMNVQRSCYR